MEIKKLQNGLKYCPTIPSSNGKVGKAILKTTFSPKKLIEFFDIYGKERKEKFHYVKVFENFLSTVLLNFRLRAIDTKEQSILAGYTFKIRENKLEEKSMFVECLARKRNDDKKEVTKKLMTKIYEDIKKTAVRKKAEEITLFVYADESRLRHNYEKLGFKIDNKCKVEKMYLLRVRVSDFINNLYFKTRKYKESLGLDSILRKI